MTSLDTINSLMSTDVLTLEDGGCVRQKTLTPVHPFLFLLASLQIQSAYDNHRLQILSTGRERSSAKGPDS